MVYFWYRSFISLFPTKVCNLCHPPKPASVNPLPEPGAPVPSRKRQHRWNALVGPPCQHPLTWGAHPELALRSLLPSAPPSHIPSAILFLTLVPFCFPLPTSLSPTVDAADTGRVHVCSCINSLVCVLIQNTHQNISSLLVDGGILGGFSLPFCLSVVL